MPKPITDTQLFRAYRYSRLPWHFVIFQLLWNTFCILFEVVKFVVVFTIQIIPLIYSCLVIAIKYIYNFINAMIDHFRNKTK